MGATVGVHQVLASLLQRRAVATTNVPRHVRTVGPLLNKAALRRRQGQDKLTLGLLVRQLVDAHPPHVSWSVTVATSNSYNEPLSAVRHLDAQPVIGMTRSESTCCHRKQDRESQREPPSIRRFMTSWRRHSDTCAATSMPTRSAIWSSEKSPATEFRRDSFRAHSSAGPGAPNET